MTADITWEYRLVRTETAEAFEVAVNASGAEGWEAVSGGFSIGETKKVSLGQGMPVSTHAGTPIWSALMKRARK
jgi:hypothetical protein